MEEKQKIKMIHIDWKQNAGDAVFNLYDAYKYKFLESSEIDEICKTISYYQPAEQLKFLGAYIAKYGYFLYEIDTDSDEFCLCLIKDSLEEEFLRNTKLKVKKLYTDKKSGREK